VVEGIGLIIRFSLRRRWFEPSQMHYFRSGYYTKGLTCSIACKQRAY